MGVLIISLVILTAFIYVSDCSQFKNCNDEVPVMMYFKFPDPLVVVLGQPINIIGGALVKETFPNEFKVKHKMQRKIGSTWWTLPCFGILGSCVNPMPCQMFLDFGFNGTCPIQPGEYKGYHLHIPTLKFPIPTWLTDGLYRIRIEGYDYKMERLWFCGDLTQYIKQGMSFPHRVAT